MLILYFLFYGLENQYSCPKKGVFFLLSLRISQMYAMYFDQTHRSGPVLILPMSSHRLNVFLIEFFISH